MFILTNFQHQFNFEAAIEWLQLHISDRRLKHSLGVQEKAVEISHQFNLGASVSYKVSIAGLLHDCAKEIPYPALLCDLKTYDTPSEWLDPDFPQVLHAFAGAVKIQQAFNIDDLDILNAVRYHTTGRAGMSVVEKVVYVADKIESRTRDAQYCQKIVLHLSGKDANVALNNAMRAILENTIQTLQERRIPVHPKSLEARSALINSSVLVS